MRWPIFVLATSIAAQLPAFDSDMGESIAVPGPGLRHLKLVREQLEGRMPEFFNKTNPSARVVFGKTFC